MKKILLSKSGFVYEYGSFKPTKVPPKKMLSFLDYNWIEIEDGFILNSFFKLMLNYPVLLEFDGANDLINNYKKQKNKKTVKDKGELVVEPVIEISDNECYYSPELYFITEDDSKGVELTSLSIQELLNSPIRISESVNCQNRNEPLNLYNLDNIRLFDVISTLIYELSFLNFNHNNT